MVQVEPLEGQRSGRSRCGRCRYEIRDKGFHGYLRANPILPQYAVESIKWNAGGVAADILAGLDEVLPFLLHLGTYTYYILGTYSQVPTTS